LMDIASSLLILREGLHRAFGCAETLCEAWKPRMPRLPNPAKIFNRVGHPNFARRHLLV
jgi:hypothetical protein